MKHQVVPDLSLVNAMAGLQALACVGLWSMRRRWRIGRGEVLCIVRCGKGSVRYPTNAGGATGQGWLVRVGDGCQLWSVAISGYQWLVVVARHASDAGSGRDLGGYQGLQLARYFCLVPQCSTNASTRVAAKSSPIPCRGAIQTVVRRLTDWVTGLG